MFWVRLAGSIAWIVNFFLKRVSPRRVMAFDDLIKEVRNMDILYVWDSVEGGVTYTKFYLTRTGRRDVVLTLRRDQARTTQNLIKFGRVRDLLEEEIRYMEPPQKQGAWWG